MALAALLNLEDTRDQNKQQQQKINKLCLHLFLFCFFRRWYFSYERVAKKRVFVLFFGGFFAYDDNSLLFFYNVIESLREKVGQFLFA